MNLNSRAYDAGLDLKGVEGKRTTKLQGMLTDYYPSQRERLGDNSELLREATSIAGCWGLSHAKRLFKIEKLLAPVQDSLSFSEQNYAHGLIDIHNSYLNQRGVKSGKLKLEKKINDFHKVTSGFEGLGEMYGSMSYEDVLRKYATSENEDSSVSESGLTSLTSPFVSCTSKYSDTLDDEVSSDRGDVNSLSVPRPPSVLPFVDLNFENIGRRDTRYATIRITVPELGISRRLGPFSGPEVGEAMSRGLYVEIPKNAEPGVYTVRISLSDYNGIRRTRHRDFRIVK